MLNVRLLLRKHFVVVSWSNLRFYLQAARGLSSAIEAHISSIGSASRTRVLSSGGGSPGCRRHRSAHQTGWAYLRDIYSGGNGELSLQIGGDVWGPVSFASRS